MAFFKFRKRGDEPSAAATAPESVEMMRKRAKHRLIGAAALVLVGVIGIPLLFDKQPRPIAVDTPIEIPDRNKVKPLNIPAPAAMETLKPELAPAEPVAVPTAAAVAKAEEAAKPPVVAPDEAKAVANPEPKPTDKPLEQAADRPADKPAAKAVDARQVQDLLEGKSLDKKVEAGDGRYVVQVGAFADAVRAREVRLKVERAGLKTYTQVAQTKDGDRIRVRVGPFADKAEAGKVVEKIKRLDLPAAILTLDRQP